MKKSDFIWMILKFLHRLQDDLKLRQLFPSSHSANNVERLVIAVYRALRNTT